ncbi:glutaminase A [Paenibacillus sp. SC116]|uniref:glutaminase A n=1 Tax=Paenibacillus sp. SC116 TaxID=2968986 RepID=UPI00215B2C80|nr:glutaminase A [Paenibacillus sp. SC116]MCR8845546.1 glutaminase A [Paenibacillus sp. SC116]
MQTKRFYQQRLDESVEESRKVAYKGRVAEYIPGLAAAPQHALGIALWGTDGQFFQSGDTDLHFTMQSISKVFSLLLALMDSGEKAVFQKVGMEPTGDDFNSILKLELVDPGKPFNPFINAGAIVIASLIHGDGPDEKSERLLQFIRALAHDNRLDYNEAVYESERETAHRNRSIAYYLKDNGVLEDDVEETLEVYFRQCSIVVNCKQLAHMALVLASDGVDPVTKQQIIPRRYIQIAKSFMVTCGMYNASGEFAIEVGLPAKSGVSGGILSVVPGKWGIGIIGPALNSKGNSVAGVQLLRHLSKDWDWSIF